MGVRYEYNDIVSASGGDPGRVCPAAATGAGVETWATGAGVATGVGVGVETGAGVGAGSGGGGGGGGAHDGGLHADTVWGW